ncbi:hypothetical protein CC85DRAFT_286387, partial [Cutaneotrichosporon oleaginosum]
MATGEADSEKGFDPPPPRRVSTAPVAGPLRLRQGREDDRRLSGISESSIASSLTHASSEDSSGLPRIDTRASVAPAYPVILGRKKTRYIRLPVLVRPLREAGGPWLRAEDTATMWLSLFYDLAVGAILSAFNGSHELQTPGEMPSYFGYYVMIVSIWTTQLHYDMRYEGDDAVHRLLKPLHLVLFVYIGAASGGWDLAKIRLPQYGATSSSDAVDHDLAADSFLTVAIAVALHRGLLVAQYIMVIVLGHKAGRPTSSQAFFAISFAVTCILAIIAATIPARDTGLSAAKITFMYASVLVDLGAILVQVVWGVQVPVRWHKVAERYGSLTLIILGQGFAKLTTVFQNSLTGLGQRDTTTYAQVFLAIGVMYNLWSLLFANFRQEVPVDAGRTWLYEIIHFPLHFCMLLLLLGMVNAVTLNSFAFGIVDVTNKYLTAYAYAANGVPLTAAPVRRLAVEMNRLDTTPDFEAEYALIQGMANGTIASDPLLESWTYVAQLIYAACEKSSVVVNGEADDLLTQLYSIDQNATSPGFDVAASRAQAENLAFRALNSIVRTALTGTLWLFPAAGATLVLCALRSMTRYHFKGATHWVVHGLQLGFGVALGLLGLLNIGSGEVGVEWTEEMDVHRPIYEVVLANMGLAVVFLSYTAVVLGSSLWIECIERKDEWKEWWCRVFKTASSEGEGEEHE